ncbi:MAG: hypothetical protein HQL67_07645 [Magnetococcales bacterium]|nr:hypothetical protein [Magnetococcales bacterium]
MAEIQENSNHKLLLEYDQKRELYDDFRVMILRLLGEFIRENTVGVYSYNGAVKSRDSLQNLVNNGVNARSLKEVDDMVTMQVITYFEDDVEAIINVLETEFKILKGAIDKRVTPNPLRFGYQSQFFTIGMMDTRLEWIEYRRFEECQVKIQVCSLLQHTWSSLQGRLGINQQTPKQQLRNTARIVGLFELADREFNHLRKTLPLNLGKNGQMPALEPAAADHVKRPARSDKVRALEAPINTIDDVIKQIKPANTTKKSATIENELHDPVFWSTENISKIILDESTILKLDREISNGFNGRLKFDAKFIDRLCEVSSYFRISSQEKLVKQIKHQEQNIFINANELMEAQSEYSALVIPRGISILMYFFTMALAAENQNTKENKEAVDVISSIVNNAFKSS